MNREYAKELFYKASDNSISYLDSTEVVSIDSINLIVDSIYDELEKGLKDINNQVSRLKKQLSKGHHIKCSCSFCKPLSCSYVDNNFTFTSCDDCKNKTDGTYQEVCSNCKRFYGCYFEAKEV